MKKFLMFMVVFLSLLSAQAQTDVVKFLGIPVDGSKVEMIRKLKAKGFKQSSDGSGALEGVFNGTQVYLFVSENNGKVCRIGLADANPRDEIGIRIRFNKLCKQFENNSKYLVLNDFSISDEEDISYEIAAHDKRYQASYYQLPYDREKVFEEAKEHVKAKYTDEQLANPTEELKEILIDETYDYLLNRFSNNSVWFMISEQYGKYSIYMFYDNGRNQANGEDL